MDAHMLNTIANFIWGIADDCLRDVYVRGKYRDVILPMTVIRRLDAVLEDTKQQVLDMKKVLDGAGISNQWGALCNAAGQAFCNASPFCLRDLTSRPTTQKLKTDFEAYLDGFSPNVQEILEKFKFRNQIDTMIDADILGAVIQKFVSKDINLGPKQRGNLPGLDNHAMGTIFEELVRRFNEANNEEAGEHWTPRDVVELMADLVFAPVADQLLDATYSCYDGACGTGGMLTVAQERLNRIAAETGKNVSIHLFGQEINPETYAIAKADMILKGDGDEAEHIAFGSTLSSDQHAIRSFDFMLANPPYGKSWKTDADKMASGKKKEILDIRFNAATADGAPLSMIPRSSDGQLLFLLNNISKMKQDTPLGSRIAEVHNGSSLFTGDAGSGESNARRFMIENDLVEAVVALPEKMFYNTGIGTFIWVLSNRKEERRKGYIQLIDATGIKTPLRKNMGEKNCELSPEQRAQIVRIFMAFEETEVSKIFPNSEFGYWKVSVQQPLLDEQGNPVRDKKGRIQPDKSKSDTEIIPFRYAGGIEAFMDAEVRPYAPGAFVDPKGTKIGYELSFTKYFYKPVQLRPMAEIVADLQRLEQETDGMLADILGGIQG
ncbi:MAG: type I restriction-modification system subunit M [Christensenellales bacterium]|jgi:type I restriction enzyme M protein